MDISNFLLKSEIKSSEAEPVCKAHKETQVQPYLPKSNDITASGTSIQSRETSFVSYPAETFRDIERKAIMVYLNPSSVIDSPELFRYLCKRKMVKPRDLVRRSSPEILKEVLTPELIKNETCFDCSYIPKECISREFAIACVEIEPAKFSIFAKQFSDPEFFLECLKKQSAVIMYLPNHDFDIEIDYDRLMKNHLPGKLELLLKYIPEQYRSAGVCMASVLKEPESLLFVPQTLNNFDDICLEALKRNGSLLKDIPENKTTELMIENAINSNNPPIIMEIPEQHRTEKKCLHVLVNSDNPIILKGIPESFYHANTAFFDKAIEHESWSACAPENLQTVERYEKNFAAFSGNISHFPKDVLLKNHDWCLKSCSEYGSLLGHIPHSLRDTGLCFAAVKNNPTAISHVPDRIMSSWPNILSLAAQGGELPSRWPNNKVDVSLCATAMTVNPGISCIIPQDIFPLLPQNLLLRYAPEHLSDQNKQQLIKTCDTYFLPTRTITATCDDLLQAYPPVVHKNRGVLDALRSQLYNNRPFFLRNQETVGKSLSEYIENHYQYRNDQLTSGMLPVLNEALDKYEVYGGRTILLENKTSCSRIKFLRSNEPLEELLREEAVHLYIENSTSSVTAQKRLVPDLSDGLQSPICKKNKVESPSLPVKNEQLPSSLPLKSEIPVSNGVFLIPCDNMPEALVKAFKSNLKKITINNHDFFLGYQFSTRDKSYSRLAHRPDSEGRFQKAEQGLLNACFDLGLWSSAGIIHTSTMMVYHSLRSNRRYLFLTPLFNSECRFPGSIFTLNNEALKETDWSWTGLKDLGDFESYPNITSYLDARDAKYQIPGYGQRCSFLNAFCENMVAALLHYAQLHQDDVDYHYNSKAGLEKLSAFTESAISNFLHGLFGTKVELQTLFKTPDLYKSWLTIAVREFTYWTEKQSLDKDCMASHIQEDKLAEGLYSEKLPAQLNLRYPDHFSSCDMEVLGINQGEFAAVRLANGLFTIAGAIAERLQPSDRNG